MPFLVVLTGKGFFYLRITTTPIPAFLCKTHEAIVRHTTWGGATRGRAIREVLRSVTASGDACATRVMCVLEHQRLWVGKAD
jgi:hypothetical protein